MSNFFSKIKPSNIKNYVIAHKIKSVIIFIVVFLVLYYSYSKLFASNTTETKYTVEKVAKTTIISTISGSGQVSASNQVDLKAKASGKLGAINVKTGDFVKAGTVIAQVDSRDAQMALESAQISYAKATEQADQLTLLQAQNGVSSATEDNKKAYSDAFSDLESESANIGDTLNSLDSMLNSNSGYLNDSNTFSMGQTIRDSKKIVDQSYWVAKNDFDKTSDDLKTLTRTSDKADIVRVLSETETSLRYLSQALKDAKTTINLIKEEASFKNDTSSGTTASADADSLTSTTNSGLNTIVQAEKTITDSERAIVEKQTSLANVVDGADPLDIKSAELSLREKQYAYEDTFIRAPFDGVLAKLDVKSNDDISSGTSVGTFITNQKVTDISLNEVDISKIKTGQKATLTFDAIDGLTIAGEVLEVDLVGTVSQGVVSYNVKIGLDTDDDRIKSGMSANASIITDVEQDIIAVPSSAIKTSGNNSYVESLGKVLNDTELGTPITSTGALTQIPVTTGVSDDTMTEIKEGLNEGDQIITKTTTGTATKTSTTAPSLLSGIGGRAAGGGAGRTASGAGFAR
ncbi:MAG: HlyD family efflux transporter periplasmic adaptor subunit [Patescibacteria group bacterium]